MDESKRVDYTQQSVFFQKHIERLQASIPAEKWAAFPFRKNKKLAAVSDLGRIGFVSSAGNLELQVVHFENTGSCKIKSQGFEILPHLVLRFHCGGSPDPRSAAGYLDGDRRNCFASNLCIVPKRKEFAAYFRMFIPFGGSAVISCSSCEWLSGKSLVDSYLSSFGFGVGKAFSGYE